MGTSRLRFRIREKPRLEVKEQGFSKSLIAALPSSLVKTASFDGLTSLSLKLLLYIVAKRIEQKKDVVNIALSTAAKVLTPDSARAVKNYVYDSFFEALERLCKSEVYYKTLTSFVFDMEFKEHKHVLFDYYTYKNGTVEIKFNDQFSTLLKESRSFTFVPVSLAVPLNDVRQIRLLMLCKLFEPRTLSIERMMKVTELRQALDFGEGTKYDYWPFMKDKIKHHLQVLKERTGYTLTMEEVKQFGEFEGIEFEVTRNAKAI